MIVLFIQLERKSTDDRFRDAFGSPTKLQGFDFGVTESSSETSQQLKEKCVIDYLIKLE